MLCISTSSVNSDEDSTVHVDENTGSAGVIDSDYVYVYQQPTNYDDEWRRITMMNGDELR